MPWYATVMVVYVVLDRLLMVARIGTTIDVTPGLAVACLLTGGLWVWGILALAGAA